MPRQNLNVEAKIGGRCKIRKRGCSSSSSSSLVRNYRLKRAILVGKRGGSSTPVPTWKMSTRSPSLHNENSVKNLPENSGGKGKEASMSARKLAATLWEINEVPFCQNKDNLEERESKVEMGSKVAAVKSPVLGSVALHSFDPSHSPVSEKMDRYRARKSVASHKILFADKSLGGLGSLHNSSLIKVETQAQRHIVGTRTRLKDIRDGLTTSKELLKVLNHVGGLDKQGSTSISLVSALKDEFDQTRVKVEKLIHQQKSNHFEIDSFLKQFAEEKAAWKMKERDRIHKAIKYIAGELEVEKKLRRQTERLNKKLGRDLATTKASLSKAVKEIESEKRAKEILEQVCDELAKGIGEDRAEVEELKRESAKVREELEKEREMLQLADVLREERVQMKLSEAKYQFEEKNAAVEKLKCELETYFRAKIGEENGDGDNSSNVYRIKELEEYLQKTLNHSRQYGEKGEREDSADSDLHSIELNMDNNSKSYEWSYASGIAAQINPKAISVGNNNMERNSNAEKTQKEIYLERQISDGIEWEFSTKSDGINKAGIFKFSSRTPRDDYEDEIERYKMIKDLRDHIVSGSGLAMLQGAA